MDTKVEVILEGAARKFQDSNKRTVCHLIPGATQTEIRDYLKGALSRPHKVNFSGSAERGWTVIITPR